MSIKPINILHLLLQKCDSDFMKSAKHIQFALMKAVEFSSEIHLSLIACKRSDGFLKASMVNAALGEVKLCFVFRESRVSCQTYNVLLSF